MKRIFFNIFFLISAFAGIAQEYQFPMNKMARVNGTDVMFSSTPIANPNEVPLSSLGFFQKAFMQKEICVPPYKSHPTSFLTVTDVDRLDSVLITTGDKIEKVIYLSDSMSVLQKQQIFDALNICLGPEMFEKYYEKELIEVSPLAFMRGRNLDDAFVILDEAQNTTPSQMKMFLTRLGLNSKACVCGDFTQIDLGRGIVSGLYDSMDVLKGVEGVSLISLTDADIVRNPLVQRIVRAYNEREDN